MLRDRARRPVGEIEAWCQECRQKFSYRASLPDQKFCRECYFEKRGDFTGALEEQAWRLAYDAGYHRAAGELTENAERAAKIIDLLPLRDVIALCHPDRHPPERQTQATAVTAALLELRERLG